MRKYRTATATRLIVIVSLPLLLAGCADHRVQRIAQEQMQQSTGAGKEVSAEQRAELAQSLEGEIHSVYASDIGLARVYGQVANLGDQPFADVEFEVIADNEDSEGQASVTEAVATFVVPQLAPGQVETFEVQTTARMGDFRRLEVRVKDAR